MTDQRRTRRAVLWIEAMYRGIDDEKYEMPSRVFNDGSIECENTMKVRR